MTPPSSTRARLLQWQWRAADATASGCHCEAAGTAGTRRRRGWLLLYVALVAVATVVALRPSSLAWRGAFIANRPPPGLVDVYGDHLQMAYFLWLWNDALGTLAHVPWQDPFQFAALGVTAHQPFGWPLVMVSLPVGLLSGPVAAYNAVVFASFVLAALAAYALARELLASPPAAAVTGFAYTFAPFRLLQGGGHVNAHLAFLLPLLLLCAERALGPRRDARRWAWATVAVFASVCASGDYHLAAYAGALLAGWVLVRGEIRRLRLLAVPVAGLVLTGVLAVALASHFVIGPSVAAAGRSLEEASFYAPRIPDLWARTPNIELTTERYVYPGLPIAVLAIAGIVGAALSGRRRLALGAAIGVAGATAVALGPGLVGHPLLQRLSRAVPPFGYIRVPGRIAIVSALLLAVAASWAIDLVRRSRNRRLFAGLAMAAIVLDAPLVYGASPVPPAPPVPDSEAVVLHLPPFPPGHGAGSVYTFSLTRRSVPIPNGYSPFATPAVEAAAVELRDLAAVPPNPCRWRDLGDRYRIEYVVVHPELFDRTRAEWPAGGAEVVAALDAAPAFSRVGQRAGVVAYRLDQGRLGCPTQQ